MKKPLNKPSKKQPAIFTIKVPQGKLEGNRCRLHSEEENPTIGVLLCNEKNDAMVELTLPEDSNIYASQYKLYLPDKKLLQDKLKEWLQEEGGAEDEI